MVSCVLQLALHRKVSSTFSNIRRKQNQIVVLKVYVERYFIEYLQNFYMNQLRNNSLSIAFFVFFLISLVGQVFTGIKQHNQQLIDEGGQALSLSSYLQSGHFLQATFENWESEFLQMFMFLVLSIFLYQKGSSESKDPDEKEKADVEKEPDPRHPDAPWPVRHGGFLLQFYKHSLSIVFMLLFILSFLLHWYGSLKDYNVEQHLKGKTSETAIEYLGNSRLWFESFQNWQSEFLSVFALVVFTIFLRQKGSPQSKPVEAPDSKTGD